MNTTSQDSPGLHRRPWRLDSAIYALRAIKPPSTGITAPVM